MQRSGIKEHTAFKFKINRDKTRPTVNSYRRYMISYLNTHPNIKRMNIQHQSG